MFRHYSVQNGAFIRDTPSLGYLNQIYACHSPAGKIMVLNIL